MTSLVRNPLSVSAFSAERMSEGNFQKQTSKQKGCSKRTSVQQGADHPAFKIPGSNGGASHGVTEVFQILPYRLQSGFGIGIAEELLEVFLDRLGVHGFFGKDQLLNLVFLFQFLRSRGLIHGRGLAAFDIVRILRDRWSGSLRVPTLQPLRQEVSKQFRIVESGNRSSKVSLQDISPVLDLLSGDAGIGLRLMEPTELKRTPSRESGLSAMDDQML